jgi:hypothetical protein
MAPDLKKVLIAFVPALVLVLLIAAILFLSPGQAKSRLNAWTWPASMKGLPNACPLFSA